MDKIKWCCPVLLSLTLWVGTVGKQAHCPKGLYLDPVTGKCHDCSSICKDAEVKKTEDRCTFYCHDYNKTSCLPHFFFNVVLNDCGSCTDLCADNSKGEDCQKLCPAEYKAEHPKRLSTGMIVLIVFIVIVLAGLLVFALVHFLFPASRRPWRTSNPYRRPQTAPDELDDPHSVFSSNGMLSVENDLAALEEEQKEPIGFSDLNLTIQNPIT